jgi:hypothetical protein
MAFKDQGQQFQLNITQLEWDILMSMSDGNEKKLRFWLNAELHNLCDKVNLSNPYILCPECDKVKKGFFIPEHLDERFNLITERYKMKGASIIKKFIIDPYLHDRHFKVYGY